MINTFSDVFNSDENHGRKLNGTAATNPFELSSTADPFGISVEMNLSAAENKFDDQPFPTEVKREKPVRARSGKDALSSSNWLAYQHSMDEANLDSSEDLQDPIVVEQIFSTNPFGLPDDTNAQDDSLATKIAETNRSFYDLLGINPNDLTSIRTTSTVSSSQDTSNNPFVTTPRFLSSDTTLGSSLTSNAKHSSQHINDSWKNVLDSEQSIVSSDHRSSNEEKPSWITMDEPKSNLNESKNVPDQFFHKTNKKNNDDDSDDDSKMLFTIRKTTSSTTHEASTLPIPLLPPPPPRSTSSMRSTDNDSSASENDDNDPLAIFRSKPTVTSPAAKEISSNLITDWPEDQNKTVPVACRSNPVPSTLSVDYYLDEPDFDDHGPLEAYHNDINDLQLQQLNTWLLQVRVPFRDKDVYKSKFQRFNETRIWQECYVRIFFDEKKLRFYLPETIEQSFAEIELKSCYQCTDLNLQQYNQYTKIHTFKIVQPNYKEVPQVRLDRLVTLPEKFFRKFTRPTKTQQVLLDHSNCLEQEIVKFGEMNFTYLKQFFIILEDLFWSMPVERCRLQKHLKEEVTVKIIDEYFAQIDRFRHIIKHKSRTRLFILAFLNGTEPTVEIGINDWFRHGKEVNKRNEIIINKTLQEYWIKPEQVELASLIDAVEYENSHLLKMIPPDSQKVEIMRFRTRPKQNIELPLQAYCFMSVINRQVIIRIELTVSNAFNMSILSKAASLAMNDKTASIRDDNSDEQCPCENIQIRFPLPDPWVYMFRVEKRFRYGAIHSVRRQAGKIKAQLEEFLRISKEKNTKT